MKNYLKALVLVLMVSVFQGCFGNAGDNLAQEKAEKEKVKKEKFDQAFDDKSPEYFRLAKESGYAGYVEYKSIEKFTNDYEVGRLKINDYRGYIIATTSNGTYAYTFLKVINDMEIYVPERKYGWVLAVGIKRDTKREKVPKVGAPLRDTKIVSFLGVSTYKTRFGVRKKVLVFDRARKFRKIYNK